LLAELVIGARLKTVRSRRGFGFAGPIAGYRPLVALAIRRRAAVKGGVAVP
jgi:hypothetical protein